LILPLGIALAQQQPANESKKSGSTTAAAAGDSEKGQASASEVKTQTYKGTLVDANCASSGGAATSSTATGKTGADRSAAESGKNKAGDANRSGDTAQSCGASANTSEFGIKTRDGQVLRFDSVGDERAKQEMSARKKWADSATAGKPIQVTVSGTESGDRLTVLSIH
jgi:flagellar capping protein FliD